MKYTELFSALEDFSDIHPTTKEVETAGREVAAALEKMEDKTAALDIDYKIGVLIRAYERQGFIFGLNVSQIERHIE
ncbi:MAG: hypothetical protein IKN39_02105 [Clostridia bacterium]|nr:hypothetical protein [Clostridia bacterium]